MDLQHINVRPQPPYTCVDSIEDVLSRKTDLIDKLSIIVRHLADWKLGSVFSDAKIAFAQ